MPTNVYNSNTPYITDLNKKFYMHGINVDFVNEPKYKNGDEETKVYKFFVKKLKDSWC